MDFLEDNILQYCINHSEDEPEVLKKLDRETHVKMVNPRMLSGHFQGRFLKMIVQLTAVKNILEIGTFTGYSAICMAEGLPADGRLDTIDINPELEDMVTKYLQEAGVDNLVNFHIGKAMDIVPDLDVEYDMVFIDADKENYAAYLNLVLPKMRKGGFILADNVLWSGKVIQEENIEDKSTQGILEFNAMVKSDDRIESFLLPLRDGLMICRKK
jgi:predicted O-methyltransferase YrrM